MHQRILQCNVGVNIALRKDNIQFTLSRQVVVGAADDDNQSHPDNFYLSK